MRAYEPGSNPNLRRQTSEENPMAIETAKLGRDGPEITRLGLGAWAIGGGEWDFGWGPQDDQESVDTIKAAVRAGVDWVDTAAAYGLGHGEEVVGRAVRELPEDERPYVFTKNGMHWQQGDRSVKRYWSPDLLTSQCDGSLRRLGVDRIDLLQIHWPGTDDASVEDAWGAMAGLVDAGKVRWIGVSNFGADLLERCEAIRHVDSVQPPLSLIDRRAAGDVIPWAAEHGTGVIVYSPMHSGLLTGKFSRERVEQLDESDHRRGRPEFNDPELSKNLELADRLTELAERLGYSLAELSVAWTLAVPGVTGAIVGARRPDQIEGWIRAADVELDDEALDAIARVVEETGAGTGPALPPGRAAA
jgi:aryl-alcohol dehydrogenase-like predicted oxidoreductase